MLGLNLVLHDSNRLIVFEGYNFIGFVNALSHGNCLRIDVDAHLLFAGCIFYCNASCFDDSALGSGFLVVIAANFELKMTGVSLKSLTDGIVSLDGLQNCRIFDSSVELGKREKVDEVTLCSNEDH